MSQTAKRARIAAVMKLLCDRFPQTFSRHDPRPLKVRVHAELLVALDATEPRDLQSALRAYTSTARYVSALRAGACRIDLDGKPAGTVTAEDEKAAKAKLAEFKKGASPRTQVPPAGEAGPEAPRDETRRGKPEAVQTVRAQEAVARRLARGRAAATRGRGVAIFRCGVMRKLRLVSGRKTEIRRVEARSPARAYSTVAQSKWPPTPLPKSKMLPRRRAAITSGNNRLCSSYGGCRCRS